MQRLTPYQTRILTEKFQVKPYVDKDLKSELARSLNISEKRIKEFFYRMRQKKQKEELLCLGEYSAFRNQL